MSQLLEKDRIVRLSYSHDRGTVVLLDGGLSKAFGIRHIEEMHCYLVKSLAGAEPIRLVRDGLLGLSCNCGVRRKCIHIRIVEALEQP